MKVREYQEIVDNPTYNQCRIIEIDDWDEYVYNFKIEDGFKGWRFRPIPRVAKISKLLISNNKLSCIFTNNALGKEILHISKIVNDSAPVELFYENMSCQPLKQFISTQNMYKNNERFLRESECSFIKESKDECK